MKILTNREEQVEAYNQLNDFFYKTKKEREQ